jgi:hypothetical protein
MMRKHQHPFIFYLNMASLGDNIGAVPALRYINNVFDKDNFQVAIFKQYRELYDFLDDNNVIIIGRDQPKWASVVLRKYFETEDFVTSHGLSLIQYPAVKLSNHILSAEESNYPKYDYVDYKIPQTNYACILSTYQYDNRSIDDTEINKICEYLISVNITPVILGKKYNEVNKKDFGKFPKLPSGVIDLIDKTSIKEAMTIMGKSLFVVGPDQGLIHLAACTDVHIICGYTVVAPELRLPVRNNIMGYNMQYISPPEGDCRFCFSDFIDGDPSICRTGKVSCKSALTAEVFIDKIKRII